jgi:hypothetical protein
MNLEFLDVCKLHCFRRFFRECFMVVLLLLSLPAALNLISGNLPSQLQGVSSLQELYLFRNKISGNLDTGFCPSSGQGRKHFAADCGGATPAVVCTCCNVCCNTETLECIEQRGTSPPVPAPTAALTPEIEADRVYKLLTLLKAISGDSLLDSTSPQARTIQWLAAEDAALVDVDGDLQPSLSQRYVLALLFFSTGGEAWASPYSFLSPDSICEWKDFDEGVSCDSQGNVIEIILCKFGRERAIPKVHFSILTLTDA